MGYQKLRQSIDPLIQLLRSDDLIEIPDPEEVLCGKVLGGEKETLRVPEPQARDETDQPALIPTS